MQAYVSSFMYDYIKLSEFRIQGYINRIPRILEFVIELKELFSSKNYIFNKTQKFLHNYVSLLKFNQIIL